MTAPRAIAFWLKVEAALFVVSGLLVALAARAATQGPALGVLDLLIWPLDGRQAIGSQELRLVSAIGGGVMVGLGATLWALAAVFGGQNGPRVRAVATIGLLVWYLVDSAASVAAGAPHNVVFNLGLLRPLAVMWRARAQPGRGARRARSHASGSQPGVEFVHQVTHDPAQRLVHR